MVIVVFLASSVVVKLSEAVTTVGEGPLILKISIGV